MFNSWIGYRKEQVPVDQYCIVEEFDNDEDGNSTTFQGEIHIVSNLVEKRRLVECTAEWGSWVQLRSPGFLPNRRQQRMFGLSILQMATILRKHINLIRLEGVGVEIPNIMSSRESKVSPNENDIAINPHLSMI